MSTAENTILIKELAYEQGFSYCGIARAQRLDDDARRLEQWLTKGMQGSMSYMENHFELRIDPTKLVPGARSVITLLFNYYPSADRTQKSKYKVSRYAQGQDYHDVIRPKLNHIISALEEKAGSIHGRGFVDSAPVLERSWALRAGLGWIGKNGNLITKKAGSYFFIATLITDLELEYDDPFEPDHCGNCTRCIDACPTDAILPGKVVDGSRCISYFTIELKEAMIPDAFRGKIDDWIFGCDICQEVCPWNRFAKPTKNVDPALAEAIAELTDADWEELTEDSFRSLFRSTPLKRAKYSGIMRNIRFLQA